MSISEFTIPESPFDAWHQRLRRISRALFDPFVRMDSVEHRKARLLACLLFVLICLGFSGALAQLALIPGFQSAFASIASAVVVLAIAYVASRTRIYRLAAMVACVAPAIACVAVATQNPDDRVWYAFMLLGVLFATLFFRTRVAALVAGAIFATICGLSTIVPALSSPSRFVPILGLHLVISPLLLIAAHHHRRLERERQVELQRKDGRLVETSRTEVVGHLAAGFAHDFGNLLAVVAVNADALEVDLGESARPRLDEIRLAIDRASTLNRQVFTLASERRRQPELIRIDDLVREIEPLLSRMVGETCRLVVRSDRDLAFVSAEPMKIEQAFMNLVLNARDAMPSGGIVSIEVRNMMLNDGYFEGHIRARPHVLITVSDTGSGMSKAVRERAFEPFFTTKPPGKGSGLGLATVYAIVQDCGGQITIASEPGKGTSIRFYLPAVARD